MIPKPLLKTEDAIETIDGLLALVLYCHETASRDDAATLHNPLGYLLNAIRMEVSRARSGYEDLYKIHFNAANDDRRAS